MDQLKTTTYKEVFQALPKDIRERAIANTSKAQLDRVQPAPLPFAGAFFWKMTPEGNDFWWAVNAIFYCGKDIPVPKTDAPIRKGKAPIVRKSKHTKTGNGAPNIK